MAIRHYLDDSIAFEPLAIANMSQALEEACNALGIARGDVFAREAIATRIIDLAHSGVTDAKELRNRVLFESKIKE